MKDYAIYFFTLILGVAIFYVFNAVESQSVLLNVSESTHDMIKMMNNMLSGVSVFVSVILGLLIIYASRFLIKRRNKEFGIYLTLGMSKRKISMILFIETMIIGLVSLVVGLGVGALLSQLMSLLVANMFEADMTNFTFIFSSAAMIKTFIYFGIMYLLVMIFNTVQVSKCKLIDLLQSSKKSEKVKIKNPMICIIVFLIAICILVYSYYKVTSGIETMQNAKEVFTIIGLGSLGTFLVFWSLSGLILKIVMNIKNIYYKELNSFTLRQISSKVNTTVFSMTLICLMLFVTICVLSSSLSIKNSMTANLTELAPVDIEITKRKNIPLTIAQDYGYNEAQVQDSTRSIEESLKRLNVQIDDYIKDKVKVNVYIDNNITFKETLGKTLDKTKKRFPLLDYSSPEVIMKVSDYNMVAKLYGNKTYEINDDEYIVVADYDSMIELRNEALKANTLLQLNGKTYTPKYDHCVDGFVNMSSNHINVGIFLVPDDALTDEYLFYEKILANYKANTEEEKKTTENIIAKTSKHKEIGNVIISANTKLSIYEGSIGLGAMVTFIGLYLGIIFLISSAAILALKELSESTDNNERFQMLRKIGTDEKLINRALFRQIAIFFAFPLVLALIHSFFGIKFCAFILETFGKEKLLASVSMTVIFLIIIYGGYFLLTYFCSKNIIKERR